MKAIKPSDELIAQNSAEYTVTDDRGRAIVMKKPGLLAQFRLVELLGGDTSKNEIYMGMVLPITYVKSIDGVPVQYTKKFELEALIQELGDEGLTAVHEGLREHFGVSGLDVEGTQEQVKK